jgi:hypothetical protein
MESTEDAVGISTDQLMALVAYGVLALLALFILLGLARWWGLRAKKPGHEPTTGLNLAELKRQREAGEITPEEYKAIYIRLSGIASEGNAAGQPIKGTGDASEGRKGSTDGEK